MTPDETQRKIDFILRIQADTDIKLDRLTSGLDTLTSHVGTLTSHVDTLTSHFGTLASVTGDVVDLSRGMLDTQSELTESNRLLREMFMQQSARLDRLEGRGS